MSGSHARRVPIPRVLSCVGVAAVLLLAAPSARGQTATAQDRLTVSDWLDWERVSDPRISPDGSQVVYQRRWVDKLSDSWESSIWIVNADGSRNRQLIDGSSPRWSPDGTRLAFTDRDEDGNTQIFVRWMDDEGAVSQVTRLTESPSNLTWSPDGMQLAFTMRVPAEDPSSKNWSISLPRPEGAEWTKDPRIVERLIYRAELSADLSPARRWGNAQTADPG
jgi:dipeptidyl aminopeptidase/acylaminoacyl peptidase